MKKLLAGLMLFAGCAPAWAGAYIEGHAGLANQSYGVRGGSEGSWDLSAGYFNAYELQTDLRTFSAEAYKCLPIGAFTLKAGGGVGFTIPNIEGGGWDKGDNDVSYVVGGGVSYRVDEYWSVGATVKGLFFQTDVHRVVYGSHTETLSTGQEVEVLDETHFDNTLNFDKVIVGLAVRYHF